MCHAISAWKVIILPPSILYALVLYILGMFCVPAWRSLTFPDFYGPDILFYIWLPKTLKDSLALSLYT
jgi:hypothetical protein